MYNRLTRRRRIHVLVFIVILFAAAWLLLQPRPTTARTLDASASRIWSPATSSTGLSGGA